MFLEIEQIESLQKKIDGLIQFGTICEVHPENKLLARANVLDRVTDFLPIITTANSFKKHWVPPKLMEQVLVLSPYGETSGVIIRGICNKNCKEPSSSSENVEIIEYSDGTKVKYDSEKSELSLDLKKDVSLKVGGNFKINLSGGVKIEKGANELISVLVEMVSFLQTAKTFTMLGPQGFTIENQLQLEKIKKKLTEFMC